MSLLIDILKTSVSKKKKAIFQATGTKGEDKLRELLKGVLAIYEAGQLKTIVDKQYPLKELAAAHRYIETGHKKGNIVIRLNQS